MNDVVVNDQGHGYKRFGPSSASEGVQSVLRVQASTSIERRTVLCLSDASKEEGRL